ncbi:MAG: hypothetical protein KC619_33825 [Myxococcales bacterium]|nr:hypothetical protein [Myxococcales bacterium]
MHRAASALVAALFALPSPCSASADPGPPPRRALASIRVQGPAIVRELAIEVRCDSTDLIEDAAACEVRASFSLEAEDDLRIEAGPTAEAGERGERIQVEGRVAIDGAPLEAPIEIGPGAIVRVVIEASSRVGVSVDYVEDAPWVLLPMLTRHPLLGETRQIRRRGDGVRGALVEGARVRVEGGARVDVRGADFVRVEVGGRNARGVDSLDVSAPSLALLVAAPEPLREGLQHGGPFVALGASQPIEADAFERFHLSVGYEVGLFEWVFVTAAFETDFASIHESVVVEAQTPQLMMIVPGLSAGFGVVARQLGDRDADAALRLRAGAQLFGAGVRADFDYWPATGAWTVASTIRVSL